MKFYFALFSFVTFASFVCIASECNKVKCETSDSNGVEMRYLSGHTIANHTIVESPNITEIEAEETDCVKECIKIPACITILVSYVEGKCWLYEGMEVGDEEEEEKVRADVYAHPGRIKKKDGHKIISLGNGVCRTQPCVYGTCIPNYDTGKYSCECDQGYAGAKCDRLQGPDLYISFDNGTADPNAVLTEVSIELDKGRLVRSPERRGKVLVVGDSQEALKMTVAAGGKPPWVSNFYLTEQNMTVSFWLKRDGKIVTEFYHEIIMVDRWYIGYIGAKRLLQVRLSTVGDIPGNKIQLNCEVPDIRQWTHWTFAGSGIADVIKLYMNGELCDEKQLERSSLTPDGTGAFTKTRILAGNKGVSLFDELKFFHSFPLTDEVVEERYNREKKELMS